MLTDQFLCESSDSATWSSISSGGEVQHCELCGDLHKQLCHWWNRGSLKVWRIGYFSIDVALLHVFVLQSCCKGNSSFVSLCHLCHVHVSDHWIKKSIDIPCVNECPESTQEILSAQETCLSCVLLMFFNMNQKIEAKGCVSFFLVIGMGVKHSQSRSCRAMDLKVKTLYRYTGNRELSTILLCVWSWVLRLVSEITWHRVIKSWTLKCWYVYF